ncbi:putative ribonuclease H protein [Glycine max]|nr:putative ribonuclease H protein [Glycine max]
MNPNGLWCLVGDFNSVRSPSERVGVSQQGADDRLIREFNDWLRDMKVEEPPCEGRKYSWFRPNGTAKRKLDRAFISVEWFTKWPTSTQFILDRNFSDHCPVLFSSKNADWGPKPFRILDCWLKDKSFVWTEDSWSGHGEALKLKYPRLYRISLQQHKLIQQVGSFNDSAWEWNLSWRRPLFDNEIASAVGFMEDISQITIQRHTADCWMWKVEPNGFYSTRSAYNLLQECSVGANLDEALQNLWKLKIPSKAAIFAWRLIKDRLPTKSNLRRRQIEINNSICPFCRNLQEDAAHLFFNCNKSLPLWWESLSWTGIVGAFSIIPRHHFLQHQIGMNGGKRNNRWKCW